MKYQRLINQGVLFLIAGLISVTIDYVFDSIVLNYAGINFSNFIRLYAGVFFSLLINSNYTFNKKRNNFLHINILKDTYFFKHLACYLMFQLII